MVEAVEQALARGMAGRRARRTKPTENQMSDHFITLIPEDPRHVPDEPRRNRARQRFLEIAPSADKIEVELNEKVMFFDCGENFEQVCCPSCGSEIPIEWWQERMDDDYLDGGAKLDRYATPCCNATQTLHELIYKWPQGFGRFGLSAMNPRIGDLDDDLKKEFEAILGVPLRVIYQHL